MKKFFERNFWIWSAILAFMLFAFICIIQGKISFRLFFMNLLATGIMVILGLGQMAVITSGEGAIDMSICYNTALAGYIVCFLCSRGVPFVVSLLATVAVLMLIGWINGILTVYVRIPAIITTLAVSYIIYTVLLLLVPIVTTTPPKVLVSFVRLKIFGVYSITIVAAVLMAIFWFIMHRTTYGYRLQATGQNTIVAKMAGIKTEQVRIIAFVISGFCCAVAGILLCAYSGGAFVDMADSYHPGDIACVVLGGTLISGGKCKVIGAWFGAMMMIFLGTAMDVSGLSIGLQELLRGAVLVLMLAASMSKKETQDSID